MAKLLKLLRLVHSYLGLIALPWVIFFGVTGFYLNHPDIVLSAFPYKSYEDVGNEFPLREIPLTAEQAAEIARDIWPNSKMQSIERGTYHGHDVITFIREAGRIIVAVDTGHFYTKSNIKNTLYTPSGKVAARKIYWRYVFGVFHRTGWLGWSLGTILADLTALALIIFGCSGLALWYIPKHKRLMRRLTG